MEVRFQVGGPSKWKADAVLQYVFQGEGPEQACSVLMQGAPWLGIAPAWRDFHGEYGAEAMLYGPARMDVPRAMCAGLGVPGDCDLRRFRFATGRAVRRCRDCDLGSIGIDVSSLARVAEQLGVSVSGLVREAVASALLSLYRYEKWLSAPSAHADPANLFVMVDDEFVSNEIRAAARMAGAEARGVCLARDMANDPACVMTPSAFAARAASVASAHGMACRVLGADELAAEGMNAFLAVAKGSSEEPKMVVVEYVPAGTEDTDPVVLVGKGICFDSGGISLKPAKGMEEMKGDMSGAAAVLGVMEALGDLRSFAVPARRVIGVMACAENMPGGHATRPGDIVRTKGGRSVEIVNTDAEGRLVLCDALAWAQEAWSPARLIDIATLTGACAVALGLDAAGIFSTDDALAERLLSAGRRLGERSWRLPLWTDMGMEVLKSGCADMMNSGRREGGAVTAAVFLSRFVKDGVRWAHVDMAAADNAESPVNAKGATGFGVRTLLDAVWD